MRKIYFAIVTILLPVILFGQAPEKISYQSIIRNASNALVTSQNIGMRISILKTTATGTVVYQETQTTTTNINGLVSIEIGAGTVVSGVFSSINWSSDKYFVKTEIDPAGGTSYSITGTSQLLSTPYALYAKKAGSNLDLLVTKTTAQALAIGGPTVTPDDILFNNVLVAPSISGASFNTSTGVYTVGQNGTYMIVINTLQTTPTGTAFSSPSPQLVVNGTSVAYGTAMQNSNMPTGTNGRGELTTVVQLNTGDLVKVKVINTNTAASVNLSTDGSTRWSLIKL